MPAAATTGAPEPDGGASARILDAVARKRDGLPLSAADIHTTVSDYVNGRVADYQMAAWLATVACAGLDADETRALTTSYVAGGERLDLERIGGTVLDKHSTGGVGDKLSLVVVPLVAACGVTVVKMSGRGLGHAGGTVDKLESVPGLRLDLAPDAIYRTARRAGMAIVSQSASLAPGDEATYALRDATGTVESVPLIAASIIGKKVAVGAHGLVLDVKTGSGALIPDRGRATELAEAMLGLATGFGLSCRAVLSDMSQPLGHAVGNALELREVLAVLRGEWVPGVSEACATLARLMLQSADPALCGRAADARVARALAGGDAYDRLLTWVAAQGGDPRVLERPALLPAARKVTPVTADRSGWVTAVDPRAVGMAAVHVRAGRLSHHAPLDHGAGVRVVRRVGDRVEAGEPLAELHADGGATERAARLLAGAFTVGGERPAPPPVIHRVFAPPQGQ
ncbi:thymidine phosphorylase [Streptomyces sp. AJS327]|uniref:thymidine phosphorylase n=1 Tax=Streptomyces sp. AJS327 TaxID=2545265 RepID=UPI0015DE2C02|nr:thymidine phosphorylase [Streptomyces sp. AJS327]MBA0051194.1 thymidine phosphorylase [Streptomyces sp. AJS327]